MHVKELTIRYRLRRVRGYRVPAARINTPLESAAYFVHLLRQEIVEVCGLLCLSAKNDVLAYHELSRGTLDTTTVAALDIYRAALLTNAAGVIIGHNHPSGDVIPSPDDRELTDRLAKAASIIGIAFLDHIIVGVDGRHFSFRHYGYL